MMGNTKKISIRKIDGMEIGLWFTITILYVFFVMILNGIIKARFPDIIYLWGVPLDLSLGVWVLGVSLWVPMSLVLKQLFLRKKVRVFRENRK